MSYSRQRDWRLQEARERALARKAAGDVTQPLAPPVEWAKTGRDFAAVFAKMVGSIDYNLIFKATRQSDSTRFSRSFDKVSRAITVEMAAFAQRVRDETADHLVRSAESHTWRRYDFLTRETVEMAGPRPQRHGGSVATGALATAIRSKDNGEVRSGKRLLQSQRRSGGPGIAGLNSESYFNSLPALRNRKGTAWWDDNDEGFSLGGRRILIADLPGGAGAAAQADSIRMSRSNVGAQARSFAGYRWRKHGYDWAVAHQEELGSRILERLRQTGLEVSRA